MWAILGAAALSILGGLGMRKAVDEHRIGLAILSLGALWGAGAIGVYLSSKYAAGAVFGELKGLARGATWGVHPIGLTYF